MYSTLKDVTDVLAPAATPSGTAAAQTGDAQIRNAIAEADSIIRTYLGSRYIVVIENPTDPEVEQHAAEPVRFWSRDIAAYLATLTYKRNKDVSADDPVRLRYNMVMQTLTKIQNGSLVPNLPLTSSSEEGENTVINRYEGTLFGPEDFDLTPQFGPWSSWPR